MTPAVRIASLLGLIAAGGIFTLAALAPDDGADATSLALGTGLGAIVAAAPLGALLSGGPPSTVSFLGGGMIIAGAATTPGGNVAGLVMAVAGLVLLLAGAAGAPLMSWRLVGSMLVYAVVLAIGMYAGLWAGTGTLIALIIAIGVASSPRWIPGASEQIDVHGEGAA